jgi:hypothetical protein
MKVYVKVAGGGTLFEPVESQSYDSDGRDYPAFISMVVEPDVAMATEIVTNLAFANYDSVRSAEFVGAVMANATREMRARAIVDAVTHTANLDTFQALASEIAYYEIEDMAWWLRSLADAIDAA